MNPKNIKDIVNLRDCDYIIDKQDRFWIVHGFDSIKSLIYANLVFIPCKSGDRYNKIINKNYKKVVVNHQNISILKINSVKSVFRPDKFFKENYSILPLIWKKIPRALIKLGIPKNKIGIFGSYLIGFDIVKDVDFLVYGFDNYLKVRRNINRIRAFVNAKPISKKHITDQNNKYNHFMSNKTSFKKVLANNWAGLQMSEGVLSTIRFVYNLNKLPKDNTLKRGKLKTFEGQVIKDFRTNFMPRIGFIKCDDKIIRVLSYFWMLNSFLKIGDKIKIRGDYNLKNRTLYLKNKKHWIKILN